MSNKKNILIRADSSSQIGLGHLMRTLLLAQGLKKYFHIIFAARELPGSQNALITQHGFALQMVKTMECEELLEITNKLHPTLCIIDHYGIDQSCEAKIQKICDVLAFDDEFKQHSANIVLNHSFIAKTEDYSYLHDTKILAGSHYTLLKDAFFSHTNRFVPLETLKGKKVLITLGGSDPLNLSLRVKQYLLSIEKSMCVTIVTTSANARLAHLKAVDKELIVDADDMARLMRGYDLIITSASTSLLETFALQKPFIAIQCASNQAQTVDILTRMGLHNMIRDFTPASLTRALNFVQYHPQKIKCALERYSFRKNGAAQEIIDEYR